MKLKQWIKLSCTVIAVTSLAACSTGQKRVDASAIDQSNAMYADDAKSQGVGQETGFGEQGSDNSQTRLTERVYHFAYDSDTVQQDDYNAIVANANFLVEHPNTKIILEGHTDPRGSREYNIGLGERRAKAVASILTAKGVNPAQIRLVSYGSEKPAVEGHDDAAFAQDRRVVLAIL